MSTCASNGSCGPLKRSYASAGLTSAATQLHHVPAGLANNAVAPCGGQHCITSLRPGRHMLTSTRSPTAASVHCSGTMFFDAKQCTLRQGQSGPARELMPRVPSHASIEHQMRLFRAFLLRRTAWRTSALRPQVHNITACQAVHTANTRGVTRISLAITHSAVKH